MYGECTLGAPALAAALSKLAIAVQPTAVAAAAVHSI